MRIRGFDDGTAIAQLPDDMSEQAPFHHILVPVDFCEFSERALTYALAIADRVGATVDVLHVWESSPYVMPSQLVYLDGREGSFWDYMKRDLDKRLEAFIDKCRGEHVDVGIRAEVVNGYTSSTILGKLEEQSYDLAVLGTHGRNWALHTLLGSVAARVVRQSPCPVITVPAPAKSQERPEAQEPAETHAT